MSALCSAQRRPAPPSALRRADPTRLLCVRVLDSTVRISLFVFSKDFQDNVHDSLEGKREGCPRVTERGFNRRGLNQRGFKGGLNPPLNPPLKPSKPLFKTPFKLSFESLFKP